MLTNFAQPFRSEIMRARANCQTNIEEAPSSGLCRSGRRRRGLRGFLRWGVVVPAVGLIQVDVVGTEALEARVDRGKDVFTAEAAVVGAGPHRVEDLGGDDDFVAARGFAEDLADDLFAGAVGVHLGGVEEIDAKVGGFLMKGRVCSSLSAHGQRSVGLRRSYSRGRCARL